MAQFQAKIDYYSHNHLHDFNYFISQVVMLLIENQETLKQFLSHCKYSGLEHPRIISNWHVIGGCL